jgi:FkbM family methyltransferase
MKTTYRIQRKSKKIIRDYILNREFIKKTKYGFKIKLDVSRDVDKHFYWGEFEVDIINFLKSLLKDSSVFVDVGANIGIYTLLASQHIKKEGKIFAFEPSDWANERLKENLKLNETKNVEVLKLAVTNFTGLNQFYVCEDDAYNSLISTPMKEVQKIVEIESICLDDFCVDRKIDQIDILKIDVEGADYLVLKGAEEILKSDKSPIIVCEFNRNISGGITYNKDEFSEFMKELSYKFFMINEKNLIEVDLTNTEANELICLKKHHLVKYNLNPKTR